MVFLLLELSLFWFWLLFCFSNAFPQPSVHCRSSGAFDCTITGTYGTWPDRSACNAARLLSPSTEQELVSAVAFGARNRMKMKAVSRLSHSITKLVCPGGDNGLIISTQNYNSRIQVDAASRTVTVDSGVELHHLVERLAESGLALPHSPYWNGLSIGGILAAGAHGSSLHGRGGAVHEYVTRLSIVVPAPAKEGYAKVLEITSSPEDDSLMNAAKVSLGVLGVISQVSLALEPMFKRSVNIQSKHDSRIEDEILGVGEAYEFGDVTWYPSQKQVVYREDERVPVETPGHGANDFVGFRPVASFILNSLRMTEELYEATNNPFGKCTTSKLQVGSILSTGFGFRNSHIFTGFPVIGFQNNIQSTGTCHNSSLLFCAWDPRVHGLFFHQTTVSIGLHKIRDFILDVKKLRDTNPNSLCGVELYSGFLMRYVKASTAFLGKSEDSVDVDITYYRARDAVTPRLNEDVLEEIEQMAVFKYQGQPHWGKNRNVAFIGASTKYQLNKFLEIKHRLDPDNLFSSEWSDAVLGLSPDLTITKDHCALEGLCICSQDKHCAPERKYYCRPGKVFTNARVCRHEPQRGKR